MQSGSIDQVKKDMDTVVSVCSGSKDLLMLLKNPIVKTADKQAVLVKVFAECSKGTQDFIQFLVKSKRESELPMVAHQFIRAYDELKGIAKATVVSALPLNEDTLNKVKMYLKSITGSSEIELHNEIDPSIIGGIVIKHEDKLLDMSVARELREIRKELIYN